ncbi:MAG: transcriptional regulator [Cyanobacteriota bacterium]
MKNVKIPTSDSWQDALVESLKDPLETAGYIEAILEEKDPEPELLRAALKDVLDARVQMHNLSEEAKICYEKLDKFLLETGGSEIYSLVELLDALGFRIAIAPKD